MRWLLPTSTRVIPSSKRCLATTENPGFRGAASSSIASTRVSPEKRQRLTELRQKMDAQKDVQLKSKRDEEEREKRLRRFNMSWIKDALWGFAMPPMMDLELAQRAVIRGIRYNDGFASELHGTDAQFTRALNAQAIMNNRIPDMHEPDEFPYCIWHPKIPTKDTCQELLHRYPQLNYQIGRVCAVAGYTDVYHSLALLPEVHIAEEARDANNLDIYNVITAQPAKYAVFDDYSRTYTPSSPRPSLINGDTCVRSMLEIKQRYSMPHHVNSNVPWYRRRGFSNRRFDITEDMSIDTYHSDAHKIDQAVVIPLLYNPLPADLPTVQKDLLILTAAVHGDIDRYARLRRPYVSTKEVACLARGIYHNPMFAKWVALQLEAGDERFNTQRVKKALHARFIMSNNLERITSDTPEADLPYLIWYPHLAERETYVELARKRPDVRIQAARACLVANYEDAYRDIDPPWDRALAREADESPNPFFAEDLRRKAAAAGVEYQGCNWRDAGEGYIEPWKFFTLQKDTWTHGHTSSKPLGRIELSAVENDMGYFGLYDGEQADVRSIEATVFASAEAREKEREALEEIEEQWPRHTRYPK